MRLAIPAKLSDGKLIDNVEIVKPVNESIVAAYEAMKNGNIFQAMVEIITGGIQAYTTNSGSVTESRSAIREAVRLMPYPAADCVSIEIMKLLTKDDYVEGVYQCPRCPRQVITEKDPFTGIDTRDRISNLEIKYCPVDNFTNEIAVNMQKPVFIKDAETGEVLETIESFAIHYPTLLDCIAAGQGMQEGQEVRVQIKIYINALEKINGRPIDRKWISAYGALMFAKTDPDDLEKLGNAMQLYGLKKLVERKCPGCGKVWLAPLNTSNFFASGLRAV